MNLKLNNLKAVIFDWDGTLANNVAPRIEAMNKVLKKMNMPDWDVVKHRGDRNISFRDNFHHIFGLEAEKAYHQFRDLYLLDIKKDLKLYDGVIEVLDFLKQNDIKICVVTNKDRKIFDIEEKLLLDKNYFDSVVCGREAPRDKPNPDHALFALKGIVNKDDINPEVVWYVGDDIIDSQCAASINALPLRVNYGTNDDLERLQGVDVYYYKTFSDFTNDLIKSNK